MVLKGLGLKEQIKISGGMDPKHTSPANRKVLSEDAESFLEFFDVKRQCFDVCLNDSVEAVKLLLSNKDGFERKFYVKMIVGYAWEEGKLNILKYFVEEEKIDINLRKYRKPFPENVPYEKWEALVKYLIEKKAEIDIKEFLKPLIKPKEEVKAPNNEPPLGQNGLIEDGWFSKFSWCGFLTIIGGLGVAGGVIGIIGKKEKWF